MRLLEEYAPFRGRQRRLERQTALRRALAAAVRKPPLVRVPVVVNVVSRSDEQDVSLDPDPEPDRRPQPRLRPDEQGPDEGPGAVEGARGGLADPLQAGEGHAHEDHEPVLLDRRLGQVRGGRRHPPFEPEEHLNLWVCALANGVLGYAQFPGGPRETDGVVIDYRAFGTRGTAQAPFDLGRTATHEVGHYFNLRHIWADTEDCSGSDFVADTPNAAGPNYGTPAFPAVSCGNGPHGDMFMNYMDYVDDAAMFLFTAQQVLRMRTALDEARPGLG